MSISMYKVRDDRSEIRAVLPDAARHSTLAPLARTCGSQR